MNKIKVLIADDEKIVREGLSEYIDWAEYNMEIAALAENGEIALKIIKEQHIDLLITDIYMPIIDGISLIKEIEDMENPPLVIIISGYSDFKYAQTALRSKIAQDYILKPLDFDQMDKILNETSLKITSANTNVQFPVLDEAEWKVFTRTSATKITNTQNEIISLVEKGDIDNAIIYFENAINNCVVKKRSRNFISRYCIELALNICELCIDKVEAFALLENDPVKQITKLKTEKEIVEYVKGIILKADHAMKNDEMKNLSPLIQSVLNFINSNYSNYDLSLNMIADKFKVSPSYLSNKFKEESSINFIKYLNGLRVKKAKELLQDISLKVYNISNNVGYDDVRYFSRIFRKYTGYTPTEYQKKITQYTLTE